MATARSTQQINRRLLAWGVGLCSACSISSGDTLAASQSGLCVEAAQRWTTGDMPLPVAFHVEKKFFADKDKEDTEYEYVPVTDFIRDENGELQKFDLIWELTGDMVFSINIEGEPPVVSLDDRGNPLSEVEAVLSTTPNLINVTLTSPLIKGPVETTPECVDGCNSRSCNSVKAGEVRWINASVSDNETLVHRLTARAYLDMSSYSEHLRGDLLSKTNESVSHMRCSGFDYANVPVTLVAELGVYSGATFVTVDIQPDEFPMMIADSTADSEQCYEGTPVANFEMLGRLHDAERAAITKVFWEQAGLSGQQNILVRQTTELAAIVEDASALAVAEKQTIATQLAGAYQTPLVHVSNIGEPMVARAADWSYNVSKTAERIDGLLRDRAETGAELTPSPTEQGSLSCVEGQSRALPAGAERNPDALVESCQGDASGCAVRCRWGVQNCDASIDERFKPVVAGYYTAGEHFRAAYDIEMHRNVTQVCRNVGGTWSWQNINIQPREPTRCGSYPSDPALVDGVERPECQNGQLCGLWHTAYCGT